MYWNSWNFPFFFPSSDMSLQAYFFSFRQGFWIGFAKKGLYGCVGIMDISIMDISISQNLLPKGVNDVSSINGSAQLG